VEIGEMLISLSVEGEKTTAQQKDMTLYSLEGEGKIVYGESRNTSDGKETVHVAKAAGGEMKVTTSSTGVDSTRTIPYPKATLAMAQKLTAWFEAGPKKGDTFEIWTATWEEAKVDTKETFTYLGKNSILWGGVQTDVHSVKVNMQGAIITQDVLSNGNPIKGQIAKIFEMRAESEELAKKLDKGGVDMIAASSIKVDKNLGASPLVSSLTMEVIGLQDYEFPASHRQKIRREGNRVFLDLKKDFRIEKAAPLSDEQKKEFTSATPSIQSDQKKVIKLAEEIVGEESDPLKRAELLKTYVYTKIRKTMASNSSTTLGVLDTMAGDCTEHTLLFVSLARAIGLPAREVTGVAHVDKMFGWHAWAEIHDGHQWVSVDPTWNELYVDATHVVFSNDPDDHSWLNVLGRVSFKALKVEKK
jgi:Transglutaminase-like superfamily